MTDMNFLIELLDLSEAKLFEDFDATAINVDSVKPDQKDFDRAEGLLFRRGTFKGDNSPWKSEASKMAKLIKDPMKLVRRAKAVAQTYGTKKHDPYGGNAGYHTSPQKSEIWEPFADALEKMGFTHDQIKKIETSKG